MTIAEDVPFGLHFPPPLSGRLALVDVNVVPMDTDRILPQQTVIVEDGIVMTVGRRDQVPTDRATVVDCSGKYLMPGLADMHVHWWEPTDVALYLANGVTTVRNMRGSPFHLALRQRIAGRAVPGPRLITTSPLIDGVDANNRTNRPECVPLTEATEAGPLVRRLAERGYQQVKVYQGLDPSALRALGAASAAAGLRMTGHCPNGVSHTEAIAANLTCFEHLVGVAPANLDLVSFPPTTRDRLARVAADFAAGGIWNCPTVVVASAAARYAWPAVQDALLEYQPVQIIRRWQSLWRSRLGTLSHDVAEYRARVLRETSALEEMVRILHHSGAPLLIGTDARNPFVVPGFSVHDELAHFANAGMTSYELLRCATAEAARFLHEHDLRGTVVEGKQADLLLVDGNPLVDLSVLRRPAAVLVNGFHLTRHDLDDLLQQRQQWARQVERLVPPSFAARRSPDAREVREGVLIEKRYGAAMRAVTYRHTGLLDGGVLIEELHREAPSGANRSVKARLSADLVIRDGGYVVHGPLGTEVCNFDKRHDGGYEVRLQQVDGFTSTTLLTEQELSPHPELVISAFAAAPGSPGSESSDGRLVYSLVVDDDFATSVPMVIAPASDDCLPGGTPGPTWRIHCNRPGNPTVYRYFFTDEGSFSGVTESASTLVRMLQRWGGAGA